MHTQACSEKCLANTLLRPVNSWRKIRLTKNKCSFERSNDHRDRGGSWCGGSPSGFSIGGGALREPPDSLQNVGNLEAGKSAPGGMARYWNKRVYFTSSGLRGERHSHSSFCEERNTTGQNQVCGRYYFLRHGASTGLHKGHYRKLSPAEV